MERKITSARRWKRWLIVERILLLALVAATPAWLMLGTGRLDAGAAWLLLLLAAAAADERRRHWLSVALNHDENVWKKMI